MDCKFEQRSSMVDEVVLIIHSSEVQSALGGEYVKGVEVDVEGDKDGGYIKITCTERRI